MGDRIFRGVVAVLVRILYNPKVFFEGEPLKGKKLKEPSIIVSNHTSHLDGPVLNTALRREKIHTLAAKDRFDQRGFGFFLRHTGCIPIDRQHADTSWIHEALKVMKVDGESVAIYPEGRHGSYRHQLPFHSGVSMLAVMAQMPIVMVYQDGPHRIFRRSKMIIGEPFRIEMPEGGLSAEFVEAKTAMLQEKMKALMDEYIRIDETQ
ncbi:MAG: 1-acyl-sn-glycerol-3-phosphate acyltransferase [Bacteroidales bacterium]|nr:1-acyl-sn-glycerol-3-phosphate acyltransferase [Bacteroidales bacterium]